MRIESLSKENLSYVVQLGKELVEAGAFAADGIVFDWDHTMATIGSLIEHPAYYIRLAYTDDDVACGIVGGHVIPFYFSPQLGAYEDVWIVREGTPGRTKIAIALMRGLVKWAIEERGALLVQSGDIASINTLAVDRLYRHLGFKRYGVNYKYTKGAV